MRRVHIVARGERGEGMTIDSVFARKPAAVKRAKVLMADSGHEWVKVPKESEWWCACDFVQVITEEVE